MGTFSTIGLIGRVSSTHIVDSLQSVLQCLQQHAVQVLVEEPTLQLLRSAGVATEAWAGVQRNQLGQDCDLLIVVGGDGSLLGVARDFAHSGVPVVGINRGGLGFLSRHSAASRLSQKISAVLAGEHHVERHFLLQAQIQRDGSSAGRGGGAKRYCRALGCALTHV